MIVLKVNDLWAREITVILANFKGYIMVENDQFNDEVFINFQQSNWHNNIHIFLSCVIEINYNCSVNILNFTLKKPLLRKTERCSKSLYLLRKLF